MATCRNRLFETAVVAVGDFICRAEVSGWGTEEFSRTHELIMPRAGLFMTRFGCDPEIVADNNHVLFINPGSPYRVAHPLPGGDQCTGIFIRDDLLRELLSVHEPAPARLGESPLFPFTHCLASPQVSIHHHHLLARLRTGADDFDAEDMVLGLLDRVLASLYSQRADRPTHRGPSIVHLERTAAVKRLLGKHFREPLRLRQLAGAVGTTPFHLSRTFHLVAGIPISRYVTRLRLQESLRKLAEGATSITELALDLGFSDHSHFTNTFKREYGMPPSAFRKLCAS